MPKAAFIKLMLWWVVLLILAMVNGIVREKLLIPFLDSFAALMASGLVLSGLIFLISYVALPSLGPLNNKQYWLVGLVWLVLPLLFEFSFGLFLEHKELSELVRAYTFKGGNLWPVVLASTLISPWLAARLRGWL
jgi:hypothetical protein